MKNKFFKIALLIVLLSNIAYAEYEKKENEIYFYNDENNKQKLKNADFTSFKEINKNYGKDKKNLYYQTEKIDEIKDDLEVFNDSIVKNNNEIYNNGEKIYDYKGEKFKSYKNQGKNQIHYVTDDKDIYYIFKNYYFKINEADIKTFEVIENSNGIYTKDKNNIYSLSDKLEKIENVDYNSFYAKKTEKYDFKGLILSIGFDKNNVYFYNKKINDLNPEKTKILDNYIFDDKNIYEIKVFLPEKIEIEGFDGNTFEKISENYYKTKNNVYYKKENLFSYNFLTLDNVDVNSFEIIKENLGKDKNNLYFENKLIDNFSLNGFKILDNYILNNEKILYFYDYESTEIKGIDVKTFEILNKNFTRDKNNIYYKNEKLDGIDINSFEIIGEEFAKDKNGVYYYSKKIENLNPNNTKIIFNEGSNTIIKSDNDIYLFSSINNEHKLININNLKLDVETFENIKYDIYKDKNKVYFISPENIEILDYIDTKTLQLVENNDTIENYYINSYYIKDKNNIYFASDNKLEKINGIDLKTFEIISDYYVKDKDNVYYINKNHNEYKKLDFISSKEFEFIYDDLVKDNKNVYIIKNNKEVEILKNIDVNKFEKIYSNYYKDDKNIYYYDDNDEIKKIEEIDINSFEIIDNDLIKDKNNVYINGIKQKNINSENFKYIGFLYKNNENIYMIKEIDENTKILEPINIKGLDTKTFELFYMDFIPFNLINIYFEDKNNLYILKYQNEFEMELSKVEDIDKNTFERAGWFYIKDKNNVYIDGVKLENIDPKTFKIIDIDLIKDKNGLYFISLENFSNIKLKKINIEKIDTETIQKIENKYYKDKNNIYYFDIENDKFFKLKGVDIKTFEIIPSYENGYVKDKNNVYYYNQKIEELDPKTFEFVGNYLKDKNGIYEVHYEDNYKIKLEKINFIDSESFEVVLDEYYKDKNNVYFKNEILKEADVETFKKEYNEKNDTYEIKDKNKIYKVIKY